MQHHTRNTLERVTMEQSPHDWAGQSAQTSPLTAAQRLLKTFLNLGIPMDPLNYKGQAHETSLPDTGVLCIKPGARGPCQILAPALWKAITWCVSAFTNCR